MTIGLQEMGKTVAATGEGINDVKGLAIADVGFAMGSGVSAAKNVSKMILVEDNVISIINAVLWGRNIYSNVRKFIQFQLTVNFSVLVLLLIIALASGLQAFSVVQLLWLNMIMDLLAALALAAERPQPSVIKNPPVKNSDLMITLTMWRQILGMTVYITIVMIFMFFFLDDIQDLTFDSFSSAWYDTQGTPTPQNVYFTMLFNIFVYLHLFNEINCRKVKGDQYNVFDNLFTNFYFLGVFCATIAVQYCLIQYGGRMARCSPLTGPQHAFCILVGSTSIIASFALKLLPEKLNEKLPLLINERKVPTDDKIVAFYKKQAEAKATDSIKKTAPKSGQKESV